MALRHHEFTKAGAVVAAVDVDSPGQHAAMGEKLNLPFPVLKADPHGTVPTREPRIQADSMPCQPVGANLMEISETLGEVPGCGPVLRLIHGSLMHTQSLVEFLVLTGGCGEKISLFL